MLALCSGIAERLARRDTIVAAGDGSSASSLIALSRSSLLARETIRVTRFPFLRTYSVPFTPYFTFFLGGGFP